LSGNRSEWHRKEQELEAELRRRDAAVEEVRAQLEEAKSKHGMASPAESMKSTKSAGSGVKPVEPVHEVVKVDGVERILHTLPAKGVLGDTIKYYVDDNGKKMMKCRHKYTPMPDEVDPDKQKDAWGGQAFSGSGSAGGDFGPASARVDGGSYPCPPAPVPEKKVEMSTAKPEEIPGYDGEDPNDYLDGYLERVDVKTGVFRN